MKKYGIIGYPLTHSFSVGYFTDKFKKYIPLTETTNSDGSAEMNLKYFDIRWSNICNFKCRSCSSTYSSSWATEDNSIGHNKKVFIFAGGDSNDDLYNQFLPHFKNIEEFYFAGGEPLLTDKHYDILEYLISIGRTNVKLNYNTNFSSLRYKDRSIISLWKHFPNIQIGASLDSWGTRAEYIREGTDWKIIQDNVRLIKQQLPHVKLHTTTVVSCFNVSTLPEFFTHLLESKLFNIDDLDPILYYLQNPQFYSFSILNNELNISSSKPISYIQISNLTGQVVFSFVNGGLDSSVMKVLVDDLPKGVYYLEVKHRDNTSIFNKIIR